MSNSVFLVTVHDPICTDSGDLGAALYGSFLPVPSNDKFPLAPPAPLSGNPGAIVVEQNAPIVINEGRSRVQLRVTNTGDRPIQIGSHYHFIETNGALRFDRCKAYGKRLDTPAGTAVRFEPGDTKTVTLVEIGGSSPVAIDLLVDVSTWVARTKLSTTLWRRHLDIHQSLVH